MPSPQTVGRSVDRRALPGRRLLEVLLAGSLGFLMGLAHPWPRSHASSTRGPEFDWPPAWRTFSEVDLLRARLDALAQERILQAQQQIARALLLRSSSHKVEADAARQQLAAAIDLLEEALAEFQGTGREPDLMRPLLFALKHAGQPERWLELYHQAESRDPFRQLLVDLRDDYRQIAHLGLPGPPQGGTVPMTTSSAPTRQQPARCSPPLWAGLTRPQSKHDNRF